VLWWLIDRVLFWLLVVCLLGAAVFVLWRGNG
jgi:hypothetical protein